MNDDIVIRFPLTAEAKRAAVKASNRSVRPPALKRLGLLAGWFILVLGVASSGVFPKIPLIYLTIFLLGAVFQLFYQRVAHYVLMRKVIGIEQAKVVGPEGIEVILGARGIKINTDGVYTLVEWKCVERLADLGKFLGIGWAATTLAIPFAHVPDGITKGELMDRIDSWRTFG